MEGVMDVMEPEDDNAEQLLFGRFVGGPLPDGFGRRAGREGGAS